MRTYVPDRWMIVDITPKNEKPFRKVFGTWAGGYLDSDSWRLNSGINQVDTESDPDFIFFYGESGSVYKCHKDSYGVAGASNHGVLTALEKKFPGELTVLKDNPYDDS